MTPSEIDRFLQRPLVAVLTTQRPDGSLQSSPVWYQYEDGTFYFWVNQDTRKAQNIRANPEISVCIATAAEPYQYVTASGRCELTRAGMPERCLAITRRYYDDARAQAFVKDDLGDSDSTLVVLKPVRLASENAA